MKLNVHTISGIAVEQYKIIGALNNCEGVQSVTEVGEDHFIVETNKELPDYLQFGPWVVMVTGEEIE